MRLRCAPISPEEAERLANEDQLEEMHGKFSALLASTPLEQHERRIREAGLEGVYPLEPPLDALPPRGPGAHPVHDGHGAALLSRAQHAHALRAVPAARAALRGGDPRASCGASPGACARVGTAVTVCGFDRFSLLIISSTRGCSCTHSPAFLLLSHLPSTGFSMPSSSMRMRIWNCRTFSLLPLHVCFFSIDGSSKHR